MREARPEQKEMLKLLCLNPHLNLICVLQCGGGKTMIIILFALILLLKCDEDLKIVVICPFRVVISEWERKLRRIKIDGVPLHHVMKPRSEIPVGAKIILQSADTAMKETFLALPLHLSVRAMILLA